MKKLLGRTDIVDFPELNLYHISIKVDSGAYTSSIHCHNIEVENDILKCQFLDPEPEEHPDITLHFDKFTKKQVKSSNGITEERFAIQTTIKIFEKLHPIELTLTERGSMKYAVLLGRKFINKKFIVDTAKKNLSFKNIQINLKQI